MKTTTGVDLYKARLNMVAPDERGAVEERRERSTRCRGQIAVYFCSYGREAWRLGAWTTRRGISKVRGGFSHAVRLDHGEMSKCLRRLAGNDEIRIHQPEPVVVVRFFDKAGGAVGEEVIRSLVVESEVQDIDVVAAFPFQHVHVKMGASRFGRAQKDDLRGAGDLGDAHLDSGVLIGADVVVSVHYVARVVPSVGKKLLPVEAVHVSITHGSVDFDVIEIIGKDARPLVGRPGGPLRQHAIVLGGVKMKRRADRPHVVQRGRPLGHQAQMGPVDHHQRRQHAHNGDRDEEFYQREAYDARTTLTRTGSVRIRRRLHGRGMLTSAS